MALSVQEGRLAESQLPGADLMGKEGSCPYKIPPLHPAASRIRALKTFEILITAPPLFSAVPSSPPCFAARILPPSPRLSSAFRGSRFPSIRLAPARRTVRRNR